MVCGGTEMGVLDVMSQGLRKGRERTRGSRKVRRRSGRRQGRKQVNCDEYGSREKGGGRKRGEKCKIGEITGKF